MKKLNNKGYALVSVLIIGICLALLGTALLSITQNSFLGSVIDRGGTETFYSAEDGIDYVRTGVQSVTGMALSNAYGRVLTEYGLLQSQYNDEDSLFAACDAKMTQYFLEELSKQTYNGEQVFDTVYHDHSFEISADTVELFLPAEYEDLASILLEDGATGKFLYSEVDDKKSLVLKGCKLSYIEDSFQANITTDIIINIPPFISPNHTATNVPTLIGTVPFENAVAIGKKWVKYSTESTSTASGDIYGGVFFTEVDYTDRHRLEVDDMINPAGRHFIHKNGVLVTHFNDTVHLDGNNVTPGMQGIMAKNGTTLQNELSSTFWTYGTTIETDSDLLLTGKLNGNKYLNIIGGESKMLPTNVNGPFTSNVELNGYRGFGDNSVVILEDSLVALSPGSDNKITGGASPLFTPVQNLSNSEANAMRESHRLLGITLQNPSDAADLNEAIDDTTVDSWAHGSGVVADNPYDFYVRDYYNNGFDFDDNFRNQLLVEFTNDEGQVVALYGAGDWTSVSKMTYPHVCLIVNPGGVQVLTDFNGVVLSASGVALHDDITADPVAVRKAMYSTATDNVGNVRYLGEFFRNINFINPDAEEEDGDDDNSTPEGNNTPPWSLDALVHYQNWTKH